MKMNLDEMEIRVLGSLMEKELATPENYPLTVNTLLSACNQKSNREPMMTLTEQEVLDALAALGSRGLARLTTTGGRVARYCHSVTGKLGLDDAARALLAELMLRGPQTPGELRSRADRMAGFADLAAVEEGLGELLRSAPPLVLRLPRQPGRKEQRYAQLLGGMPEIAEEPFADQPEESEVSGARPVAKQTAKPAPSDERLVRLEGEVAELREGIALVGKELEEILEAFGG